MDWNMRKTECVQITVGSFLLLMGCLLLTATLASAEEETNELQMFVGQWEYIFQSALDTKESLQIQSSDRAIVDVDAYDDGSAVIMKAKGVGRAIVEIFTEGINKPLRLSVAVLSHTEVMEENLTLKVGERHYVSLEFYNDRLPHLETDLSIPGIVELGPYRPYPVFLIALKEGKTVLTLTHPIQKVRKRVMIKVLGLENGVEAVMLDYWIKADSNLKTLIELGKCNDVFVDDARTTIALEGPDGILYFLLQDQLFKTLRDGEIRDPILSEMLQKKGYTKKDALNVFTTYSRGNSTLLWKKLLGCRNPTYNHEHNR